MTTLSTCRRVALLLLLVWTAMLFGLAISEKMVKLPFIWLLGVLGIWFGLMAVARRVAERDRAEAEARRCHADAESLGKQRTGELQQKMADLQKAREAGMALEESFRLLANVAPVGILKFDPSGICEYANSRWCRMVDLKAEAIIGSARLTGIHPVDRKKLSDILKQMPDSAAVARLEFRILRESGEILWLFGNISPLKDPNGKVIGALLSAMDITHQKNSEAEQKKLDSHMREAQKLESLGVLAGGIAHDFNNLLGAILGNAELASMDIPRDCTAQRYLIEIVRTSERAADLCKQLLSYSGKAHATIGPIGLPELVKDMSKMLNVSIGKKSRLELKLDPAIPIIEGNKAQITQIVMNLIINASDALSGKEGTISASSGVMEASESWLAEFWPLDLIPSGRYVYFEVSDTGCGMDFATKARIFDPFFTTKASGRGLGLSAVVGIIRAHKGFITVDSELGRGTTFRVGFPAMTEVVDAPMSNGDAFSQIQVGWGNILLADDDLDLRKAVRRMIEKIGFTVIEAVDGRDAIEQVRAEPGRFAMIILDLTMPRTDGAETYKKIVSITPDARVIITSGLSVQEVRGRFPPGTRVGFLQKPFDLKRLAEKISQTWGFDSEGALPPLAL